jgi:hypothetical protein
LTISTTSFPSGQSGRREKIYKSHKVENSFSGDIMHLRVDGMAYQVNIAGQSQRLAVATEAQRKNFVVSPSGSGIDWPEPDEDLSIDGLIGIKHQHSFGQRTAEDPQKKEMMATAP